MFKKILLLTFFTQTCIQVLAQKSRTLAELPASNSKSGMYTVVAANSGYVYLLTEKDASVPYYPLTQMMAVENSTKTAKSLDLNMKKGPGSIIGCFPNDFGLDVLYFKEEKDGKKPVYNLYIKQVNGIEQPDKDMEDRQILSLEVTPGNKKDPRTKPRLLFSDDTAFFAILGDQEAYIFRSKTYSQVIDMKTVPNVETDCFLTRNGHLVLLDHSGVKLKAYKYGSGDEQTLEIKPDHPYFSKYKACMELDMIFLTCLVGDKDTSKGEYVTREIETSVLNTALFQIDITRKSPLSPQTLAKTKGKGLPNLTLTKVFVIDQNVYFIAEQLGPIVKDVVYDDVLMGRISPDDTYTQKYIDKHFVPKKGGSNSTIFLSKSAVIIRIQKDEFSPQYLDADNNFGTAKSQYADDQDNRYFPAPDGRRYKLNRADPKRLVLSIGN